MNILMVLTSHDELGDTGKKTGFWLEEFAAPYYVFKEAGARVTPASPKGGQRLNALAPDGGPLVRHKRVTGFTNREEEAAELTDTVPFLLEDALLDNGAHYGKGPVWAP